MAALAGPAILLILKEDRGHPYDSTSNVVGEVAARAGERGVCVFKGPPTLQTVDRRHVSYMLHTPLVFHWPTCLFVPLGRVHPPAA
jgi:hypothetical protein